MYFRENRRDPRRYNQPLHDEVAAVFVECQAGGAPNRKIVTRSHYDHLQPLPYYSTNCDLMSYPPNIPCAELNLDGAHIVFYLICLMEIGNTLRLGTTQPTSLLSVGSAQSCSVATFCSSTS